METANYIYVQLSDLIHEDKPRILTASDNINKTIYIDTLTESEKAILDSFVNMVNTKLSESN